jgi:hypothetical protein
MTMKTVSGTVNFTLANADDLEPLFKPTSSVSTTAAVESCPVFASKLIKQALAK